MENKKEKKVEKSNLFTFVTITVTVVAVCIAIVMSLLYGMKNDEIAKLESEVKDLDRTIAEVKKDSTTTIVSADTQDPDILDGNTIIEISNETIEQELADLEAQKEQEITIESKTSSKKKTKDDMTKVKKILKNYLELSATNYSTDLLETLTKKGNLKYRKSKSKELSNGTIVTNVKFKDYKKAMLKYVTEKEFNKNWTEPYYREDADGYLLTTNGGGSVPVYTIKDIQKNGNTYTAKTTYIADASEPKPKYTRVFTFTLGESYVGNMVIDTIEFQ